jgi:hypothetical protein
MRMSAQHKEGLVEQAEAPQFSLRRFLLYQSRHNPASSRKRITAALVLMRRREHDARPGRALRDSFLFFTCDL